jgi:hypothetical protein
MAAKSEASNSVLYFEDCSDRTSGGQWFAAYAVCRHAKRLAMRCEQTGLDSYRGEPDPWMQLGQPVRVNNEALAGIEGFVVQKNKGVRIVLILDFPMQSIAIEVDGQDIELIDTSFPQALKAQPVKEQQRLALYDFHCLDSYSDSSRFFVSAGF